MDMSNTCLEIDLDYRPAGYFWPLDLATHLLATVKGAERRKYIQSLIDANRLDVLEDLVAHSSLEPEVRAFTGRIHPRLMGGEYLPNLLPGEVEIARVTLASTTQDVVSIRARKGKNRIRYRVVDEYEGETLTERNARTSIRPLTLGQLIAFLDGAWSIREVVAMNEMQCDVEEMRSFVKVSSPFYPGLIDHYDRCFVDWADECEQPEKEDADDMAAAGREGGRHA
jgi:hypothetical protein